VSATEVAKSFYDAFARLDGGAMAACYADDVRFSDPVFRDLRGDEAKAMWRMLCSQAKDLRIDYRVVDEHPGGVTVAWDAYYTFSKTKRPVKNQVRAHMTVKDGVITSHRDDFSFWRWSSQALGLPGKILGWTPLLQKKVQATAAQSLAAFMAKAP